ncbi:MAG: hypothetical protein OEV31_02760 [Gammaproteobacteria bacterium]|nr:hypothetical protein [Gammaproteobacteria bacterium]
MTNPEDSTTPQAANTDNSAPMIFEVHSVEKSDAPDGGQGRDWYRYVLKNRRSTITGHRRGSQQHVREYAAQYAEQLNTRAILGPTTWNPRRKKVAATVE